MHTLTNLAVLLAAFTIWGTVDVRRSRLAVDGWIMFLCGSALAYLVCARVGFIAFNWQHYAADPIRLVELWKGGTVVTAGFLGMVVAFFVLTKLAKLPRWQTTDVVARCAALYFGVEPLVDVVVHGMRVGHALYDGLMQLALFGALIAYRARQRFAGEAFLLWAIASAVVSAVLSATRDDRAFVIGTSVDTRQVVAALTVLVCGVVWARKRSQS